MLGSFYCPEDLHVYDAKSFFGLDARTEGCMRSSMQKVCREVHFSEVLHSSTLEHQSEFYSFEQNLLALFVTISHETDFILAMVPSQEVDSVMEAGFFGSWIILEVSDE